MIRSASAPVWAAACLGALALSGLPSRARANPAPETQTLSWDLQIPMGKRRARLTYPPIPCPGAGQQFHVTGVDASLMFGEYVAMGKWVVSIAVRQQLPESKGQAGARPLQYNVFAEGVTTASGRFGAGQPFDGTVDIVLPTPAPFLYHFAVHLAGACQVPSKLPTAPTEKVL